MFRLVGVLVLGLAWPVARCVAEQRAPGVADVAVAAIGLAAAGALLRRGPGTGPAPVIPVGIAAAAGWSWAGDGRPATSVGLLALALAASETIRRSATLRSADGAVSSLVDRVARRWIPNAVVLVVATVVLFAPSALLRLGRWIRHGSRRRPPGWRETQVARREILRDAAYPFATTPGPVRDRRLLTSASIATVGVVIVVAGWPSTADRDSDAIADGTSDIELPARSPADAGEDPAPPTIPTTTPLPPGGVSYTAEPAFADAPWASELQADEQRATAAAGGDVSSRWVNVAGGVRRSRSDRCDCPIADVWLAGGDEAFGLGQRDFFTVASELNRLAVRDGTSAIVSNLGRPQISPALLVDVIDRRLATGARPSLIIVVEPSPGPEFESAVSTVRSEGRDAGVPTLVVRPPRPGVTTGAPRRDDVDLDLTHLLADAEAIFVGPSGSINEVGAARVAAAIHAEIRARSLAPR